MGLCTCSTFMAEAKVKAIFTSLYRQKYCGCVNRRTPGGGARQRPSGASVRSDRRRLRGGVPGLSTARARRHGSDPVTWKAGVPWKKRATCAGRRDQTEFLGAFLLIPPSMILSNWPPRTAPTLSAALARVDQARAVARITRADLFPGVSLDPNGNRTHVFPQPPGAAGLHRARLHRKRIYPAARPEL